MKHDYRCEDGIPLPLKIAEWILVLLLLWMIWWMV